MINELDCDIIVSELELQLCYQVHFQINTIDSLVWLGFMAYQPL